MTDITHTQPLIITADKYSDPSWAVYEAGLTGYDAVDIYDGDGDARITLTVGQLDQLAIQWIQHRLENRGVTS